MMTLPESQWEWWYAQTVPRSNAATVCQRCGGTAEKVSGLTRHHEKKDGKRTGRVTKLCLPCHNAVHNLEAKYISARNQERAFHHVSGCEDCADKMLRVIDHAQSNDENNCTT